MVDAADNSGAISIYLGDRGYASFNSFAHVIENNQYFLIRCTDKKTESLLGYSLEHVKELDCHVDRILSRSESKKLRTRPELTDQYRHVCKEVPMGYLDHNRVEYDISLRVVRFEIAPGCFEKLITNLPKDEFNLGDFKDLYHLRWSVENSFRDIKYSLCLKDLHSKKYEYIVQEI